MEEHCSTGTSTRTTATWCLSSTHARSRPATCNPANPGDGRRDVPGLRDHARRGPAPDVQGARASCVPGNPTRIKKKAPPYQFVALKHRLRTWPRGGEDDGGR